MSKVKQPVVEINVKKWGRHAYTNSCGKCCAIGFALNQGVKIPFAPYTDTDTELTKELIKNNIPVSSYTNVRSLIISTNDNLSGATRRTLLQKLFDKVGIKLKFKNL